MSDLEVRFFAADMELRGREGRTVTGLLVPFDEYAEIGGRYREVFRRGAFADAARPPLYAMHRSRHDLPLGRFDVIREDTRGLYGEAPVARTAAGDEALELVRDGVLDHFSIGFTNVKGGDRWSADHRNVERLRVQLREASLVAAGAYATAAVEAVRDDNGGGTVARPRLNALRRYLDTR